MRALSLGLRMKDAYFANKLTFALPTKDGGVLRTLWDVHAYLEALPKTRQLHVHWQHVKRLLLRGDPRHVGALTRRVQVALFLDGRLADSKFRPDLSGPHWRRRRRAIHSS
jgi:hypothetical protein